MWVYDNDGKPVRDFLAYEATFTGGVRTALADLNADGVPDIVTGAGPGGGPRVRTFDGASGTALADYYAYEGTFTGGVWVAAGPVSATANGIATGADAGGAPRVRLFTAAGVGTADFYAFDKTATGGVRVALGRTTAGASVYAASGTGTAPVVSGFDAATLNSTFTVSAGSATDTGGVSVAAGDLLAGGADEVVALAGPGATGAGITVIDATGTAVNQGLLPRAAVGVGIARWGDQRAVVAADTDGTSAYTFEAAGAGPALAGRLLEPGSGSVGGGGVRTTSERADYLEKLSDINWPAAYPAGQSAKATSTVSEEYRGGMSLYKWSYDLFNTNVDFQDVSGPPSGPYGFTVYYVPAASQVIDQDDNLGWDNATGEYVNSFEGVHWLSPDINGGGGGYLPVGGTGKYWFYTKPTEISVGTGEYYSVGTAGGGGGSLLAPDVRIKSVTWENGTGERGGVLSDNPRPEGDKRVFAEKSKPSDSVPKDQVVVRVELSVPVAGIAVRMYCYDVDDPSYNRGDPRYAEVDSEEDTGDNRNDQAAEGAFSGVSDDKGVVFVTRSVSHHPGDNYRVVATVDPAISLATDVKPKQSDGTRAGVYFQPGGRPIAYGENRTVQSRILTVWRTLHMEFDQMTAPGAADGPFRGVGVGNTAAVGDDDEILNGPVTAVDDISMMEDVFKQAYIAVKKDLGPGGLDLNKKQTATFVHNLPTADEVATLGPRRDVPTEDDFWTNHVVACYEGPVGRDNDPNTAPATMGTTPGSIAVFRETIRDVSTNAAGAVGVGELVRRIVLHESLHTFSFAHGFTYGDEGPLRVNKNIKGTFADHQLTPGQVGVIRLQLNPNATYDEFG